MVTDVLIGRIFRVCSISKLSLALVVTIVPDFEFSNLKKLFSKNCRLKYKRCGGKVPLFVAFVVRIIRHGEVLVLRRCIGIKIQIIFYITVFSVVIIA